MDDPIPPPLNGTPTARARADANTVRLGQTVTIDGSASSDPDGDALTLQWLMEERPAGSSAALEAAGTATVSFTADREGEYVVRLSVSDGIRSASAAVSVVATAFSGAVVHVDASNTGVEDGTSARPFATIGEAVAFAASGDWIKVAEGEYRENITIPGTKGLFLMGGYQRGNFNVYDPDGYPTLIRGSGDEPVIGLSFSGGPGADIVFLVQGFHLTGGQRGVRVASEGGGGSIAVDISNNRIYENGGLGTGDDYGGGVSVDGCPATVRDNVIRDNRCGKGAGLAIQYLGIDPGPGGVVVSGNLIEGNIALADHGGGVYLALREGRVTGNVIRGNRVGDASYPGAADYGWGGGMIIDGGAFDGYDDSIRVELSGNRFIGNYAQSIGGGLFVDEGANVRVVGDIFFANASSAGDKGGAAFHADGLRRSADARTELSYCTFAGNRGEGSMLGNAIHITGDAEGGMAHGSVVLADHCVFWDNLAAGQPNQAEFFLGEDAFLSLESSAYQHGFTGSGEHSVSGCSTADPEFASLDPESPDFLRSGVYADRGAFALP